MPPVRGQGWSQIFPTSKHWAEPFNKPCGQAAPLTPPCPLLWRPVCPGRVENPTLGEGLRKFLLNVLLPDLDSPQKAAKHLSRDQEGGSVTPPCPHPRLGPREGDWVGLGKSNNPDRTAEPCLKEWLLDVIHSHPLASKMKKQGTVAKSYKTARSPYSWPQRLPVPMFLGFSSMQWE